mmetsp:Transcript_38079/g.93153  ORF Transcript_38079/g.93153 Transcript_38079/m.93153 type:complete len:706 (-) Transcript_38079:106-2223(-)
MAAPGRSTPPNVAQKSPSPGADAAANESGGSAMEPDATLESADQDLKETGSDMSPTAKLQSSRPGSGRSLHGGPSAFLESTQAPGNKGSPRASEAGTFMDDLQGGSTWGFDEFQSQELGNSLISFARLEEVLSNVMEKFRELDMSLRDQQTAITKVENSVADRPTNEMFQHLSTTVEQQLQSMAATITTTQKSLGAVDDQLERTRGQLNLAEGKIDQCQKEKALQDRVIRDIHDSLMEKATVTELNDLTAQMSKYAKETELNAVIHSLSEYASVVEMQKMWSAHKELIERLGEYPRITQINNQMHEERKRVEQLLKDYTQLKDSNAKFGDLDTRIRGTRQDMERAQQHLDSKIAGVAEGLTRAGLDFNAELNKRALSSSVEQMKKEMKQYASKKELVTLKKEIHPRIEFCTARVSEFETMLAAQDGAIQRVDTLLLDKASKTDLTCLKLAVDNTMSRDVAVKELDALRAKQDATQHKLDHYLAGESARFNEFKGPDHTDWFRKMEDALNRKAEKADVVDVWARKANRIDADELAKLHDVVHRQLEYLSSTVLGLSKLALSDTRGGESKTIRAQQKGQLMMQAEAVWGWILHNSPPPNLEALTLAPGIDEHGGFQRAPDWTAQEKDPMRQPGTGGGFARPKTGPPGQREKTLLPIPGKPMPRGGKLPHTARNPVDSVRRSLAPAGDGMKRELEHRHLQNLELQIGA